MCASRGLLAGKRKIDLENQLHSNDLSTGTKTR